MDTFLSFCLPSVQNQSNQDFTWLICIDVDSETSFIDQLTQHLDATNLQYRIVATTAEDMLTDIQSVIRSDTPCRRVITSRLDNDDILHQDYISTVQQMAEQVDTSYRVVLDLVQGYQLVRLPGDSFRMLHLSDQSNAFVSLVEPSQLLRTVWSKKHTEWLMHLPRLTFHQPRWMQYIHTNNVANKQIMHLSQALRWDYRDFGLPDLPRSYSYRYLLGRPLWYCWEKAKYLCYTAIKHFRKKIN